jgi:hypothetical protein
MNSQSEPHVILRKNAEAWLAHNPSTDITPRSAKELQLELQVHQIELEMQNDELRTAPQNFGFPSFSVFQGCLPPPASATPSEPTYPQKFPQLAQYRPTDFWYNDPQKTKKPPEKVAS